MVYDRHISLLTSFPKVFEQVIHERLLEILNVDDDNTWVVQVVRYPNFFSGMEADRNVKVVGGDVAVL